MEIKEVRTNREIKDRVFNIVTSDNEVKLEIYNALNGTNYTDATELEVTTLDNAVYMGMKNDVSFLVSNTLNLYEHQSTFNPNMPIRDLMYVAKLYEQLLKGKEIYAKKAIKIPRPNFIVFYNGNYKVDSNMTLKLSDLYEITPENQEVNLELIVKVININGGHNEDFKRQCVIIREYSIFIDKIHEYQAEGKNIEEATKCAIEYCINNHILEELLRKERDVIMSSILTEYNAEEVQEMLREEAWDEGREEGREYQQQLSIIRVLERYGKLDDELIDRIKNEKSIENLEKLFQISIDVSSIEEFQAKFI